MHERDDRKFQRELISLGIAFCVISDSRFQSHKDFLESKSLNICDVEKPVTFISLLIKEITSCEQDKNFVAILRIWMYTVAYFWTYHFFSFIINHVVTLLYATTHFHNSNKYNQPFVTIKEVDYFRKITSGKLSYTAIGFRRVFVESINLPKEGNH